MKTVNIESYFTQDKLRSTPKVGGVYVISHIEGVYIGGTSHLYNRRHHNEYILKRKLHHCVPLQEAYNRDPSIAFKYFITDPEQVFNKETEILKWYRENGFNVFNRGGEDSFRPSKGFNPTAESRAKMRASRLKALSNPEVREKFKQLLRQSRIKKLSINGVEYNGAHEASEKLGVHVNTVTYRARSDSTRFKEWQWIS